MKMDKAWGWIIDPQYKIIQHKLLQVDDNLDTLRKVVDCKYLESVSLQSHPNAVAFCDEEGRLCEDKEKRYFSYQWLTEPHSGMNVPISDVQSNHRKQCPVNEIIFCKTVVVFGINDEGDISDAPLDLMQLASSLSFLPDDYTDEPNWEYLNLSELH